MRLIADTALQKRSESIKSPENTLNNLETSLLDLQNMSFKKTPTAWELVLAQLEDLQPKNL